MQIRCRSFIPDVCERKRIVSSEYLPNSFYAVRYLRRVLSFYSFPKNLINTKCYLVTTKSAYENRTPNWYTTDVSHPTEIVVSCARCARIHGRTEALSYQHTADPHWIIALPHCVAKADQVAPGLINGYPIWRQTNLNLSSPVSTPSQKQLFIALIESTQICITGHRSIYTIFIRFSYSKFCFVIKQFDTNLQSNITHRFSFASEYLESEKLAWILLFVASFFFHVKIVF